MFKVKITLILCIFLPLPIWMIVPKPVTSTSATVDAETDNTGLVDCNKTSFSAVFGNIPPYAFKPPKRNGTTEGAVHMVLLKAIRICCGSNTQLNVTKTVSEVRNVEEEIKHLDIAYPVVKTGLLIYSGISEGYIFMPVMETAGSMVMVKAEQTSGNIVGQSIGSCWPLAVIVVSSAGLAGVIMWLLDRAQDDFPKSYIRGGWEGTWWAFVTMTTVGYGDRAPRSLPARLFGLVWIFMGIILMSIFTATLTTALSLDQSYEIELKGSQIGVLIGTNEEILAYREGASVIGYQNPKDLLQSVYDESVEAALLDINFALYHANVVEKAGVTLGRMVANKAAFGIILQNQNSEIENCMAKEVSKSQFEVYDELIKHLGSFTTNTGAIAAKTTQNVLSAIHSTHIGGTLSAIWFIVTVICLIWEFLYYRPKQNQHKVKVIDSPVSIKHDEKIPTSAF